MREIFLPFEEKGKSESEDAADAEEDRGTKQDSRTRLEMKSPQRNSHTKKAHRNNGSSHLKD